MKTEKKAKNVITKILITIFTLSIPLMLILDAVNAKKYTDLKETVLECEARQEAFIEDSKKKINDIAVLTSAERIEKKAQEYGMHKAETEDIVRVDVNGEKK